MAKLCLTLFFTFILSAGILSAQNKDSIEGDFEALMALYESTDGDNWNNSWDLNRASPETMGDLYGITVYPSGHEFEGRVRTIKMNGNETLAGWGSTDRAIPENVGVEGGNNLVGILPPEIGNLQKLKYINVKQNFLTGEIPASFWKLQSLEWAALAGQYGEISFRTTDSNPNNHSGAGSSAGKGWYESNSFTGSIPNDIDMPELIMLEIRRQFLTGVIPSGINGAPKLRGLFLNDQRGGTDRLGGNLPSEIGDLLQLERINIGNYGEGNFDGQLPSEFLQLEHLFHIRVSHNNFTGPLPVFNTQDLRTFDIGDNNFTGAFPISLFQGNNAYMTTFNISDNNLSGSIPEDIIQPDERDYAPGFFDVQGNNFEGPIPLWIRSMRHKQMKLGGNNFTGGFPVEAAEAGRVRLFWIQENDLSGELPDVDWKTEELSSLLLSGNNFTGPIPESWETIITNHLDGEGNYEGRLGRFEIIGNELSGVIPAWIANVPTLWRVKFHGNRFTFKDILPNYQAIKNNVDGEYQITPQKPFGASKNRSMPAGERLILDLSEFDYEGNRYQWVKDGTPIDGANASTLTISNVSSADEGEYVLQVSNPALPELGTHSSEPITVQIGENDGGNSGGNDGSSDDGTNEYEPTQKVFPEAPVHIGPDSSSSDASLQPKIGWSSVEGADYYQLHMSRNNPNGMVLDIIIEDTTYTPSEILGDNSLHHWRVRAVQNGEPGDWSGVWKFTTSDAGLPEMVDNISPISQAENIELLPEFLWEQTDADEYGFRLLKKESEEIVIVDQTGTTSYSPIDLLEVNTEYIWQVKSNKNGVEGAWGPRWEFSTGEFNYVVSAPYLLSPNQGEEYETLIPTFEWESVDAEYYIISVTQDTPSNAKVLSSGTGGGEDDTTIILDDVTETVYTSGVTLEPETKYYWRVQGVKDGEEGEWSETWEFRTPASHVNISTSTGEKPLNTQLRQNFPNPFNPTTQIEFTLTELQHVTLSVYNIAGQQVETLVDGVLHAGRHTAIFDAGRLASGVYLYRFISDTHHFTKKMTLVK